MVKIADMVNSDIRDAFFDEIYKIAAKDKNVIFITADADAFSLRRYKKDLPGQFINLGVAEQNMITVAAGLALSGKKVFTYALAPFITMRCYEHIKVNICSMNLPVVIIGAGAGMSFGNDGPTHHAVCDIAIMRTLPEMTIFNPSDSMSAFALARIAHRADSPVYIRLDKGKLSLFHNKDTDFSSGISVLKEGHDVCIISTGIMTHNALEVADKLSGHNITAGVVDLYRVKPVDEKLILRILSSYKRVITLEENTIIGGIGTLIAEILVDNNKNIPLKRIALKDEQCFYYGDREWLHRVCGIDKKSILEKILIWEV